MGVVLTTPAWANKTLESVDGLINKAQRGYFYDGGDHSDPAMLILRLANRRCGPSKHDRGEYRARRLLRFTEALVKAVRNSYADDDRPAAENLWHEINKSNLYKSCWRTMRNLNGKISWTFPTG